MLCKDGLYNSSFKLSLKTTNFSIPGAEAWRSPFDLTQGRSCVVFFFKGYEIQRSLETAKETVRQLGSGDAGRCQYHQSSFRCRPPCSGEDEGMRPLTMRSYLNSQTNLDHVHLRGFHFDSR